VVWKEEGGPEVSEPERRGFGTTLIERALSYEFDATVERTFDPGGLKCVFELPLTDDVGYEGAYAVKVEDG
jgi:two-component system CheB/CheR fusion protein